MTVHKPIFDPVLFQDEITGSIPINTSTSLGTSNTQAPSQNAVKVYVDTIAATKLDTATFTGHTHTLSEVTDSGTIASQDANAVNITGGSITGITDLAIADGGTGASTAIEAFDNLSPLSAKGSLLGHDGTNNVAITTPGDDYLYYTDSSQTTGINTTAPSAAGDLLAYGSSGYTWITGIADDSVLVRDSTEASGWKAATSLPLGASGSQYEVLFLSATDTADRSADFTYNSTTATLTVSNFEVTTTSSDVYLQNSAAQDLYLGVNSTYTMRFDSTGQVVLGDTSAEAVNVLEVKGDGSNTGLSITGAATNGFAFVNATNSPGDTLTLLSHDSSYTVVADRIINVEGDTGFISFGDVDPDVQVHIWQGSAGTVEAFDQSLLALENDANAYISILTPNDKIGGLAFGDPDSNTAGVIYYDHSTQQMDFEIEDTVRVSFTNVSPYAYKAGGSSWGTLSDQRLKKDVEQIENGLDIIKALMPVEFEWINNNENPEGRHPGFIAQEYEKVLPNLVFEADPFDGKDKDLLNGKKAKLVNQDLFPYVVSAIKELVKQIEEIKRSL